ncbi:DUF1493 family protein [Salmonella enterica subsp. enterica serovar Bredeney]|nr:DUF1493 family protein [Salmonella enterica subsp. enterica serovar Bredeney]EDO5628524.1 DUF1493 family protein [Salmonella enterica]EDR9398549.1 DUF1493 family protein [Salmonella enterica subsp. enterica]EDT6893169.1 DUF1493 family protein [Salmonella enterica subsp. enterica serovar Javiana]ECD3237362.1 DUF1493 family protein [Salmonella enterica subsp. enterica serovar Bredeney]
MFIESARAGRWLYDCQPVMWQVAHQHSDRK